MAAKRALATWVLSSLIACLPEDFGARRNRAREPDVAADDRAPADDRVAAEDAGAGVDRHLVFQRGVTLRLAERGPRARQAERAQRDTLVELHVVADDAGRADDDPGAVVHEEAFADGGARVDVH